MTPVRAELRASLRAELRAELGAELHRQAAFLGDTVPVYAGLLAALDARLHCDNAFTDRLLAAWRERRFSSWYDRPLLLLAALQFESLYEERAGPGADAGAGAAGDASAEPTADASARTVAAGDAGTVAAANAGTVADAATGVLVDAGMDRLVHALDRPRFWQNLRSRRVQTNEVSRAVAWLWPCELLDLREVVLVDLGCSAGLNLAADALDLGWRDGGAPLVVRRPHVLRRVGYDLKPGDVTDDDAMAWLRACVWPGQPKRVADLEAAIAAARLYKQCGELILHAASLVDVPARLDSDTPGEGFVLAYQTIVRDYLTAAEQERYTAGMFTWLARRRGTAAWVELEHHPEGAPCAIVLHAWREDALLGGVVSRVLATCGAHPECVDISGG